MSDRIDNQNWAYRMMDGEEEPAFSGPLNPHVGFEGAEAG